MYKAREAVRVSGLTYRQLDHIVRAGALQPMGGGGQGRGCPRQFGVRDLVALRLAREVIRCGLRPRRLVGLLRFVQFGDELPSFDKLGRTQLWTDGTSFAVLEGEHVTIPRSSSDTVAYLMDLGRVAADVHAGLERLKEAQA